MGAGVVKEDAPRRRDQDETSADEREAQDMERPEVRVRFPAKQHFEQMARVVGEPIDARIAALQPPDRK